MAPLAYHIVIRLVVDRPLLCTVAERRFAARSTLRHGEAVGLLAFLYADTHGHFLVTGDRSSSGEFARQLSLSLHRKLRLGPFERARIREVGDVWHLANSARYVFEQRERHGVSADPYMEASNVPDLLGMRELGGYTRDVLRAHLPRFGRSDLVERLPADPAVPTEPAWEHLADAAAAAVAVPSLLSRSPDALVAKQACMALGAGLRASCLAELLGISERTVRRLRTQEASPAMVRAVQRQLWLRTHANAQQGRAPIDR